MYRSRWSLSYAKLHVELHGSEKGECQCINSRINAKARLQLLIVLFQSVSFSKDLLDKNAFKMLNGHIRLS